MSLTLEQALATLRIVGCAPEGGPMLCPMCRKPGLVVAPNGDGPHVECEAGCDALTYLGAAATQAVPRGPHVDQIAVLRERFALPELERIVKHGRHGESYEMHLSDGRTVDIGSIVVLTTQVQFRRAFLTQVRRNPPRYKPGEWDAITETFEQAAEEVDEVATADEETLGWIESWLPAANARRDVDIGRPETLHELLGTGRGGISAFYDTSGRLYLKLDSVVGWLNRMGGARVTVPELSTRLLGAGFTRARLAARQGEEIHRGRYWVSPGRFGEGPT